MMRSSARSKSAQRVARPALTGLTRTIMSVLSLARAPNAGNERIPLRTRNQAPSIRPGKGAREDPLQDARSGTKRNEESRDGQSFRERWPSDLTTNPLEDRVVPLGPSSVEFRRRARMDRAMTARHGSENPTSWGGDTAKTLLEIRDLHVHFGRTRVAKVLNGVTLTVSPGEAVGLVGETGSGKSITAAASMRLVPPPGRIVSGGVVFAGEDLLSLHDDEMRPIRGGALSLIVQNAKMSLHPLIPVGRQMANVYRAHSTLLPEETRELMFRMLTRVGFADPERIARSYVHQLSGGMAQRIVIAMAIGTSPQLVIADEPTTGLDAIVQAQVLDLLNSTIEETGAACLLITHDLGVVANYCDRVAVMHAGRIVEQAPTARFLRGPSHPYSVALLDAYKHGSLRRGLTVTGTAPDPRALPSGCMYRFRCPLAADVCRQHVPESRELHRSHWVECHRAEEVQKVAEYAGDHSD